MGRRKAPPGTVPSAGCATAPWSCSIRLIISNAVLCASVMCLAWAVFHSGIAQAADCYRKYLGRTFSSPISPRERPNTNDVVATKASANCGQQSLTFCCVQHQAKLMNKIKQLWKYSDQRRGQTEQFRRNRRQQVTSVRLANPALG